MDHADDEPMGPTYDTGAELARDAQTGSFLDRHPLPWGRIGHGIEDANGVQIARMRGTCDDAARAATFLADTVNAGERPQPRVWREGEDVPAGVYVLDQDGDVHLAGETEPDGTPVGMYGFGTLVEVVLPDYAVAIAADDARRAAAQDATSAAH